MYAIKLFINFMQFFWLAEVNNDKEVEDILLYFILLLLPPNYSRSP